MGILWTFCWQRSHEFSLGLTSQSLSHGRPTGRFGTLRCCLSSCWPAGSITLSLVRPCESLRQFTNICGMAENLESAWGIRHFPHHEVPQLCPYRLAKVYGRTWCDLSRGRASHTARLARSALGWIIESAATCWETPLTFKDSVLVGEKKFNCIEVYGLKFSSRKSLLLVSGSLMIFADPEIAKAYAVHIALFAPGEHHHNLRSRMEGFEWKNLRRKWQLLMGVAGWTRSVEDVEDSWRTCDRCQDLVVRVVGSNLDLKLDMPVDSCDTLSLRFNQTVSLVEASGSGGFMRLPRNAEAAPTSASSAFTTCREAQIRQELIRVTPISLTLCSRQVRCPCWEWLGRSQTMRCWCNSIGKWKATVCCLFGARMPCVNHESFKLEAACCECWKLFKKPQASHFIDSGEQRLSPITGILKQALSILFMLNHIEAQCLQFMFCSRGARSLKAQLSAFRDESCRCGFDLTWMHHIQGIRGVFNTRGGSSCTFLECLDNLDSREKQRASMSQLSQMMQYWKWINMKEFESHLVS